jgi:AraC-like DNA-binding protein
MILEILARGGAVAAFVGLALVIARGGASPARVTGVLFCIAVAAHTLTQHAATEGALGLVRLLVLPFSWMGAGLFWAFATELFGDRTQLKPLRFAPAAALLALGAGATMSSGMATSFVLAQNFLGAALIAHVLFVIWSGWRNDLVESRRRLRGPMLAAGALYAGAVIAVQIAEIAWQRPADALSPLAAAVLLTLGLSAVGVFLKADEDLFSVVRAGQAPEPAAPADLGGEEKKLSDKLDRQMRDDCAYRDESLTITSLALRLNVPEYRLRRLINQQLGHRNFSAFLNQWRLSEAKAALADPGQRDVPISTIALDAGFASLGPFNRAFKADTDLTPSEFRARALASPDASAGQAAAIK